RTLPAENLPPRINAKPRELQNQNSIAEGEPPNRETVTQLRSVDARRGQRNSRTRTERRADGGAVWRRAARPSWTLLVDKRPERLSGRSRSRRHDGARRCHGTFEARRHRRRPHLASARRSATAALVACRSAL